MSKIMKLKVLTFDPGLSKTGWALCEINPECGALMVVKCGEIHPATIASRSDRKQEVEYYGKRVISLSVLRENMTLLLNEFNPDYIVMEDIFINPHRPMAYGALSMWHCIARDTARSVAGKPIIAIPTKSAKLSIAGRGDSNKMNVQQAIAMNKSITFKSEKLLESLSEHCADSIAVAHSFMTMYLPSILADNSNMSKHLN